MYYAQAVATVTLSRQMQYQESLPQVPFNRNVAKTLGQDSTPKIHTSYLSDAYNQANEVV